MENENIQNTDNLLNTGQKTVPATDKSSVNVINVDEYYQDFIDSTPHITKAVERNKNRDTSNPNRTCADTFYYPPNFGEDIDGGNGDIYNTFQKYRQGYYTGHDPTIKGIYHMFMTKPNLNLLLEGNDNNDETNLNIETSSFIKWMSTNYPDIIKSLKYSGSSTNFVPLLSNHFKSVNIDDLSFMDSTLYETYKGFSQKLPTTSSQSSAGGSISVSYEELSPPLITYLHKVWFDYIELIKFGYIVPSKESIKKKEIDYAASLYLFSLDSDGETINFWCRYTGIIPSNVPYSSFAGSVGSMEKVDISISYMYSHKEFLEPDTLMDFNDIFSNNNLDVSSYSGDLNVGDTSNKLLTEENPNNVPISIISGEVYPEFKTYTSPLKQYGYYKYLEKNYCNKAGVIHKDGKFKLIFY